MGSSSESDDHELGHVVPMHIYLRVLFALMVLTVVTVLAAQLDFGVFNLVIAMLIASVKASIVALYFMHLKYENPVTWAYVLFPILVLFLMIGGVFLDNPFRVVP